MRDLATQLEIRRLLKINTFKVIDQEDSFNWNTYNSENSFYLVRSLPEFSDNWFFNEKDQFLISLHPRPTRWYFFC